ncbi:hypothetical protein [Streptomyces sp. NBC_01435]|uniref:hypothetical protein n=1 Tax=Streptomyces sp. NBC_01435 TaxID=2903865 RepID=UPI002E2EBFC3|nr:hypothetical protein [Streptomyces sp. NBC_01435]
MMLLEECGPDEVNPDTAVRCLESMGYELLQFSESERNDFAELLERMASSETDTHTADFIRSIPFAIGMTEVE